MSPAAAPSMEEKGRAIARCLGYRDLPGQGAPSAIDAEPPCDAPSWLAANGGVATDRVDLWHLRTLALQPGGLLNSHGRKLGWIKLAGVDALVFQPQYRSLGAPQDDDERCTHDEIRAYLAGVMGTSRWHIQRERKHLRQRAKKPRASSTASYASHASNDLSSIGGSESGSTTPLTANLHSNAGTPRSVTFAQGDEPSVRSASAGAPFSFMAFQSHRTEASSTTSFASFPSVTVDTTFRGSTPKNAADKENHVNDREASPSSNEDTLLAPSPLSLPCSPGSANHAHFFAKDRALPQDRAPLAQFHVDITPVKSFLEYSQRYQQRHRKKGVKPPRAKKDRRQQERKLLVQIATSAFYMLRCQLPGVDLQCYEGLQDLIAVLLLRMESPSATSLLLRQVLESHLWMHCTATEEDDAVSDDASFASCMDDEAEPREWDVLSMSFFPLLQVVDGELHASLVEITDGQDFLRERVFGEVLQKWISSWLCCHDALPVEVVSRVVDLFLASHPSMPLYLSTAVLCHSVHREKLLAIAQQEAPVATVLDSLFSDLPQELGLGDEDELLADFLEQCISTAIAFMKQVPPKDLSSLTKGYQNSILLPCIKPRELESLASTSPWTYRSRAPTDYKMIERMFSGAKIGSLFRFSFLGVGVADQIALDASGLSADAHWNVRKRRGSAVIIVGVVLVALMGLLQPQYYGGSDGEVSVPFSGDGIQPIVPLPLNVKKTGTSLLSKTGASAPPAEDDVVVSMRDASAEDTSAARMFEPLSEMSSVVSLLGRDETGGKSLDADDDEPAPVGTTKKEPKRAALEEVGTKRSRAVALIKGRALAGVVGLRDGFIALVENDDFFL